jgi:lysyl-tRNA synthetase, class II
MADSEQNLHTDPVTGEKISKSELKRRQKQREVAEKKAAKEKEQQAKAKDAAPKAAKTNEEELTPNQYFEIRSATINELKETKKPNP